MLPYFLRRIRKGRNFSVRYRDGAIRICDIRHSEPWLESRLFIAPLAYGSNVTIENALSRGLDHVS